MVAGKKDSVTYGRPKDAAVYDYSQDRSPRILILGFAVIVLVGTILLMLPIATENGIPLDWREALFTATSAVTVTGLIVVSTVERLSTFGDSIRAVFTAHRPPRCDAGTHHFAANDGGSPVSRHFRFGNFRVGGGTRYRICGCGHSVFYMVG